MPTDRFDFYSAIAGLFGGIVSAMLFFVFFERGTRDRPELGFEFVCITGLCLIISLFAGPALGIVGGRIGAYATRNTERAYISTGGKLIGGFLGGMLYAPIILLFVLVVVSILNRVFGYT